MTGATVRHVRPHVAAAWVVGCMARGLRISAGVLGDCLELRSTPLAHDAKPLQRT